MKLYEVTFDLTASEVDDFTRLGIVNRPLRNFKIKTVELEDHTKPIEQVLDEAMTIHNRYPDRPFPGTAQDG